jgi:hypothetical protein
MIIMIMILMMMMMVRVIIIMIIIIAVLTIIIITNWTISKLQKGPHSIWMNGKFKKAKQKLEVTCLFVINFSFPCSLRMHQHQLISVHTNSNKKNCEENSLQRHGE